MRFLRQLAAAAAVLGIVVLLGYAWNRFAPTIPGEGPHGVAVPGQMIKIKVLPPGLRQRGGRKIAGGGRRPSDGPLIVRNSGGGGGGEPLLLSALLQPVNLAVLKHTAVIEGGVMAAVVIVNASYRSLRRRRRARSTRPRPGPADY